MQIDKTGDLGSCTGDPSLVGVRMKDARVGVGEAMYASGTGESLGVQGTVVDEMLTTLLLRGLGQPDKLC